MLLRTCANPPVTRKSTDLSVPNLLSTSTTDKDEEADLPPPFNPPKPLPNHPESNDTQAAGSTPVDGNESAAASTPTNQVGLHLPIGVLTTTKEIAH